MTDAKIGDNIGTPYAEGVTERLELDYAEMLSHARDLLTDTEELPSHVEGSLDVSAIASAVVQLRDIVARSKAHRAAEKEPFLRAGDAVYAFFTKRLIEPLDSKRLILQARIDVFKQRQLAEERARRQAEAEAARKAQQEAQRLREAAEAAARRARSPETIEQRADEVANARLEAEIADIAAEETTLATMATASRMVGERFEGERSGQVGMRRTGVCFIEDPALLDLEALRPYLKEDHLLMALKAWAKATNYSIEMPGATVAMRDSTIVR